MKDEPTLIINEMFSSIQGESSYAGFPFFFIRTTGCNLRCKYCDTKYAFSEGKEISIKKIVEKAEKSGLKKILITGGEPLIQKNVYKLIDDLLNKKFEVFIETNGSILIDKINKSAIKIVDVKTPSSGECEKNKVENLDFLTEKDEVKFVISDFNDFLWSKNFVEKYKVYKKIKNILFSPVYGVLNPEKLANWILEHKLNMVRLQLQLHKIIGMK